MPELGARAKVPALTTFASRHGAHVRAARSPARPQRPALRSPGEDFASDLAQQAAERARRMLRAGLRAAGAGRALGLHGDPSAARAPGIPRSAGARKTGGGACVAGWDRVGLHRWLARVLLSPRPGSFCHQSLTVKTPRGPDDTFADCNLAPPRRREEDGRFFFFFTLAVKLWYWAAPKTHFRFIWLLA